MAERNERCLQVLKGKTYPFHQFLQLVGLLLSQFVSELLGFELLLFMFLLRLCNGSDNKQQNPFN